MAVFLAKMVIPRSRSNSLESITRSTRVSLARKVPLCLSMASTSVVLPWSTCAMIAILRIAFVNGRVLDACRHRSRPGGRSAQSMTPERFRKTLPPLASLRERNGLVSGVYGQRALDAPGLEAGSRALPPASEGETGLPHAKVLYLYPIEPGRQGRRDGEPFVGGIRLQP